MTNMWAQATDALCTVCNSTSVWERLVKEINAGSTTVTTIGTIEDEAELFWRERAKHIDRKLATAERWLSRERPNRVSEADHQHVVTMVAMARDAFAAASTMDDEPRRRARWVLRIYRNASAALHPEETNEERPDETRWPRWP